MENLEKILEFYKKTSSFTDLGFYKEFAKNLPDDIEELCLLQRHQIIHPFDLKDEEMRKNKNSCYGDMTKIDETSLCYENDLFPTAQAMIAELLRREKKYSKQRKIENKIHVCCREHAILLSSILKAKGIPARARSGFAKYVNTNQIQAGDHWITEYFDEKENKWRLVDADEHCPDHEMGFDLNDIPYDKFLFGANAYLGIRQNKYKPETILYSSDPPTLGLKASIRGLFYDFHALMNNEIIFLHMPKYVREKNLKFRIMSGGMN